jgi:hypothetical protein
VPSHVETRHHELLFEVIDIANAVDLPVSEITDPATAAATTSLLDAARTALLAVQTLTTQP